MELFKIIMFFVFGIVFGSFFNVVGLRTPKNKPFHNDRSYCPTCQTQLSWYELIPVISYIIQKGKCRHCEQPIAILYPIIELLTGLLFVFAYVQVGLTLELMTALLLTSLAMILIVTDLVYMLIPNKILLFFLPLFIILRILSPLDPWYDSLIGGGVGFLLIMIIILISKGGMGAGDMKLFGVLGIILGWKLTLFTLFIASFIGALIGSLLMLLNKIERRQPIPFGPYILLAALISYYFGDKILTFYYNLL